MAIGYGNHETQAPGESADPKVAATKPQAGATDRPGMDLGGAKEKTGPAGALGGEHANPGPSGVGPHGGTREAAGLQLTDADDETQTPGAGTLPTSPQGDEVDPGAG